MAETTIYFVVFHGNSRTLAKVAPNKVKEWQAKNPSSAMISEARYQELLQEIKVETVIS